MKVVEEEEQKRKEEEERKKKELAEAEAAKKEKEKVAKTKTGRIEYVSEVFQNLNGLFRSRSPNELHGFWIQGDLAAEPEHITRIDRL